MTTTAAYFAEVFEEDQSIPTANEVVGAEVEISSYIADEYRIACHEANVEATLHHFGWVTG